MLLGMSFEREKGGASPTLTQSSLTNVSKFQSTLSRVVDDNKVDGLIVNN